MTYTDLSHSRLTPEDVRSWLVERVAYYVQLAPTEIDPDVSFAEHGLDSVYAFTLCGDIEDALGLSVEPTVVWDFDTLTALTAHLVESAAGRP
jgi:acyl carrier protein